ncbi:choice-of-anchor G family protein [Georgenia sunbinii]|uniref:choice-of-anchor G family protein n=1 Tax=Georgenia sunbinii TaxID=3117728 RepID=UPI002F26A62E
MSRPDASARHQQSGARRRTTGWRRRLTARRRPAALLAATLVAAVGLGQATAPTDAQWTDQAYAEGTVTTGQWVQSLARAQLIDVDGLSLDVADAIRTDSNSIDSPGANTAEIDADVLQQLVGLDLPGIELPLIGDDNVEGLLNLGNAAGAGLLKGYATSPAQTTSTAASGTVDDSDGSIGLDAGSSTDFARLDLGALLSQLQVEGLTNEVVRAVSLEVGALASRADADGEDLDLQYLLAGAELNVSSPLLGTLSDTLATTYEATGTLVEESLRGLVGSGGLVDDALGLIDLPAVTIPLLATVELDRPTATLDVTLPPLGDVPTTPISSPGELVTIDLSQGTIGVDIAKLLKGTEGEDLNGLDPNTSVLTDETIEAIVTGVAAALGALLDSINETVLTTLHETELTVSAGGRLRLLLGLAGTDLDISLHGTLAGFAGLEGAPAPSYGTIADITLVGVTVPAGDLINLVVEPLLASVTAALGPVLDTALTTQADVLANALTGVVDVVLEPLEPVLDGVLSQLVTITINEQPEVGDLGEGSATVRALALSLLPGLLDVGVDLASSSVLVVP